MAFGDRSRYKSVATAFYSLLSEFNPSIEGFPQAARVPGFPKEAVVITPLTDVSQLIWLESGRWRSWIIIERRDGSSETIDAGVGPVTAELPARWALGYTLKFYDDWLQKDDPAQIERAREDRVSLSRVFVEEMSAKVRRVVLS